MRVFLFVTFNADPAHTGFSRRVKSNVESALATGRRVAVVRFVPCRSRGWSWKGRGFPAQVTLIEIPLPPVKRSRALREISVLIASAVLRIIRSVIPGVTFVGESHEAAFLCSRAGVPFVVDIHGDVVAEQRAAGNMRPWLSQDARYLRRASATICVSERMRDAFLETGRIRRPCYVVPVGYGCEFASGVDRASRLPREQLRACLGLSFTARVAVYSGGMQHYQRFDDICAVMKKVLAQRPDTFFLVCTKSIKEARRSLDHAKISADRFKLVSCEPDDLARWLVASDVGLVLRKDDEINQVASPTKILEYARAGLAVVCGGIEPPSILLDRVHTCGDGLNDFYGALTSALDQSAWSEAEVKSMVDELDRYCLPGGSSEVFRNVEINI